MHPDKVGPYLIDRKIGAGGMGNVYHGVHELTKQEAAIKVLPVAMAREDGFVQRFSREIDALRQLSNRHIVQLFQDGETTDGTFYYAMEFVDGHTLTAEITNRKKLPWKDVIEYSMQIAAALKAAHDAGIVHRDLKPSNLMLTNDRVIKLTDFGVASLFASARLTRTGGVVGTAEYMSPEQARGQKASRRSDLYSLGAVMYVMLTGRPPFTGASANDILQKHQFGQFDKPSRYVADLPRLVEGSCQKAAGCFSRDEATGTDQTASGDDGAASGVGNRRAAWTRHDGHVRKRIRRVGRASSRPGNNGAKHDPGRCDLVTG